MFTFLSSPHDRQPQAEIADLERMAAIPFPVAHLPLRRPPSPPQQSYEAVAASIGFLPAEMVRLQLLSLCAIHNIPIYNYKQVSAWLTKKKMEEKDAKYWCWRPLRTQDVISTHRWGWVETSKGQWGWSDGCYSSRREGCEPYEKLVPLHALQKVALIETTLKSYVNFFVSDYSSLLPDPFLMVCPSQREALPVSDTCYVIDAWKEPGFGVEETLE